MGNYGSSAAKKHKDFETEEGVCLCTPGVCILCLYMYFYIYIYIHEILRAS